MAHEKGKVRNRVRADLEAFLKSLGSTASEIQVFLALFRARKYVSIREISDKINLSSKSIRNALKRLEERGLVIYKEKDGKRLYRSVSAREVMEKWKKSVEDTLSHLIRRP